MGHSEESLLRAIRHYQESLDRHTEKRNESKLLYYIEKLRKLPIQVAHLEQTGVGRTVNALRKLGGSVGDASKALVAKWKEMVVGQQEQEARDAEESADEEEEDEEDDDDDDSDDNNEEDALNIQEEEVDDGYSEGPLDTPDSPDIDSGREDNQRGRSRYHERSRESSSHKHRNEKEDKGHSSSHSESSRHSSKHKHKHDHEKHSSSSSSSNNSSNNKHKSHKRKHENESDSDDQQKHHKRSRKEENSEKISKTDRHSENYKPKKRLESNSDDDVKVKEKSRSKSNNEEVLNNKDKKKRHKSEKRSHDSDSDHRKSKSESSHRKDGHKSDDSHKKKDDSSKSQEHKKAKESKKEKRNEEKEKDVSKTKSGSSSDKKVKETKVKIKGGVNGIDSGSGASFAEALGMCEPSSSKATKKRSNYNEKVSVSVKEKTAKNDEMVPKLLKEPTAEPVDVNLSSLLPTITPNYRPLGNLLMTDLQPKKSYNEFEALSNIMTSKNQRTKVYSGNKTGYGKVPSLFEMCIRILQDNIDALEYTGGVPYLILKPILDRATPSQLFTIEDHNPYLIEDTDDLWQVHCQKDFRSEKREELETCREMYMRCLDEREAKLKALTANIKLAQDKSLPVRTTKLAYVDSVAKPPRNIARKQAKNGTAITPSAKLTTIATSGEAGRVAVPNPGARAVERTSHAAVKIKKAPLMAKSLSLLKNRFRR